MKNKVVLYGAYDRYNYGDNLMPILLERFFRTKHPHKTERLNFIYASIDSSDLSKYSCMPTVAMKSLLSLDENSSIIVVGGEVLGADVGTLYTHVQDNYYYTRFLKAVRRYSPGMLTKIAKLFYPAVWIYPYIPQKSSFKNKVKVIYNTVGGAPVQSQINYIKEADYISSRDQRTFDEVNKWSSTELVPDSVLIASEIVDDAFFSKHVRKEITDYCRDNRYITVQACPYKVQFTAKQMARELDSVKNETDLDVILLPIGYASGHDDVLFLKEVQSFATTNLKVQYELNVWEIMYLLSRSQSFYGTSLHGVITAMSFGIPHFCLNGKIDKITSFVKTWSVAPFIKPITVTDIKSMVIQMEKFDNSELLNAVSRSQGIISASLNKVADML
ncbi:polysaccharide pyruvyl transferase family protein [Klebsiella pasteurii]|uniref:polysaccharide pyruvyl transferase family protein n=1 Tax=Klebsiella pasteurii TaxID=2587529 RepID=UPI00237A9C8E|nr:polysaccharide pyruvyl transferase family protein [Klebsiella pasteurii]MDD9653533.1 polysaccharide pyruvyl transferase family protein [Klebsiella pasteurii]